MSEARFEPFACAPGMQIQAQEKLAAVHNAQLREQLTRLEQMIERLERRMWLAVYGVAAAILSQAVQHLMSAG